jgi:hypothetical protein
MELSANIGQRLKDHRFKLNGYPAQFQHYVVPDKMEI